MKKPKPRLTLVSSTPRWLLEHSAKPPPQLVLHISPPTGRQILRDLLLRPGGCTADEIQASLRWRSVQALRRHAKAVGLEVVTFKATEEDPERYMGQKISRQRRA